MRQLKSVFKSVLARTPWTRGGSSHLQILDTNVPEELSVGWQQPVVAERQEAAFAEVLSDLKRGNVREDFAALAAAVAAAEGFDPLLIEIGAGSGWNHGVLELLLQRKFRYIGVDYSKSMVDIGKRMRPEDTFLVGDATALPLGTKSCDVLILGTVLMHVLHYSDALLESRRVTRRWCIFHTIPVLQKRATTILRKNAYGVPVVEVTFNEKEFLDLLTRNGFKVRQTFESIAHSYLDRILGEPVHARTYLCEC
jgi:ubiquinone/menaquinone biosynthesis C-methylase UbiE